MGVEVLDDAVGGIAELADVQEVGLRIVLGTARDRGPAEDDHAPVTVRARDDVVDEGALHVHPRHQHRVRPLKIRVAGGAGVLVDEADVPRFREVAGHDEQALRRHERADTAAKKRICILKGAERRSVPR